MNGTYGPPASCTDPNNSMYVTINSAGSSSAPITLKAQNKWGAVLDAQMRCHSVINFGSNSAWWVIKDFDITGGYSGGVWSNSNGGRNIKIVGNHIHHIGNRPNTTSIGEVGVYTDAGAIMWIDGNVINDVGRTDDTGSAYSNSYDHGIYSHGAMTIVNNVFYRALWGWHIQTASSFSGLIANNTFVGPNMYPRAAKAGSIMLWDVAGGSIDIRNNIFSRPIGPAVASYAFGPRGCYLDHNLTDASAVYDNGASCSVSGNAVATDPALRNASLSSPDVHLQAGSPAIDAGAVVAQAPADMDGVGRPQRAAYDLGAAEY